VQEIIALNQDDLGVPGDLIWQQGTRKVGKEWRMKLWIHVQTGLVQG
jgi:hypothetical protein